MSYRTPMVLRPNSWRLQFCKSWVILNNRDAWFFVRGLSWLSKLPSSKRGPYHDWPGRELRPHHGGTYGNRTAKIVLTYGDILDNDRGNIEKLSWLRSTTPSRTSNSMKRTPDLIYNWTGTAQSISITRLRNNQVAGIRMRSEILLLIIVCTCSWGTMLMEVKKEC